MTRADLEPLVGEIWGRTPNGCGHRQVRLCLVHEFGRRVSAKSVLRAKGLEYSEIRIDTDPAKRDEMLTRSGGRRTVPQIFINGELVGGHDDLVAADRNGRLAQLLGTDA